MSCRLFSPPKCTDGWVRPATRGKDSAVEGRATVFVCCPALHANTVGECKGATLHVCEDNIALTRTHMRKHAWATTALHPTPALSDALERGALPCLLWADDATLGLSRSLSCYLNRDLACSLPRSLSLARSLSITPSLSLSLSLPVSCPVSLSPSLSETLHMWCGSAISD